MKKLIAMLLFCCIWVPCAWGETNISLQEYTSRVAASVVSQVAGVLSGFEFVGDVHGQPRVPLPEEWFALLGGPYGGGRAMGGAGESRMLDEGIGSDDDYHIDFFNQHILSEEGTLPSHAQIMQQWRSHRVSDWGGGAKAMQIMRTSRLTPPFTGLAEYGNIFHWCTEPYIENETLGLSAPGMPYTAFRLGERFASVTGDFDSLDWALFWVCAYAEAFTETEVAYVLERAAQVLLPESQPMRIYEACVHMYREGKPWAEAVIAIEAMRQHVYDSDNIQCAPDVNNGFGILALLYGEGDWLESVHLASISGYDGDCTAATVGGLLGAMQGLEALPREVLDTIWQDGKGVYVNDPLFPPHIQQEYPFTQTFADITELYVQNGLAQIQAAGGKVEGEQLQIPKQTVVRRGIQLDDFEGDTLHWLSEGNASFSLAQEGHTGWGSALVKLQPDAESAQLTREVSGLIPGETYALSAYVQTSFDGVASIGVEGEELVSAYNANKGWCLRTCYFTASADTARVMLRASQRPGDGGIGAYFDDVRVEQIETPLRMDWRPFDASAQGGDAVSLALHAETTGDHGLMIRYGNTQRTGQSAWALAVDGTEICRIAFPGTGQAGADTLHTAVFPVQLAAGEHTLTLAPLGDPVALYAYTLELYPTLGP